jgi:hypothetical protein
MELPEFEEFSKKESPWSGWRITQRTDSWGTDTIADNEMRKEPRRRKAQAKEERLRRTFGGKGGGEDWPKAARSTRKGREGITLNWNTVIQSHQVQVISRGGDIADWDA